MLIRIYNISKIYTWNTNSNLLDVYTDKEILIEDGVICDINDSVNNDAKCLEFFTSLVKSTFLPD